MHLPLCGYRSSYERGTKRRRKRQQAQRSVAWSGVTRKSFAGTVSGWKTINRRPSNHQKTGGIALSPVHWTDGQHERKKKKKEKQRTWYTTTKKIGLDATDWRITTMQSWDAALTLKTAPPWTRAKLPCTYVSRRCRCDYDTKDGVHPRFL